MDQTYYLELPLSSSAEQAKNVLSSLQFPCKIWIRINVVTSKVGSVIKTQQVTFTRADDVLLSTLFNYLTSIIKPDQKPLAVIMKVATVSLSDSKTRECPSCLKKIPSKHFIRHAKCCGKSKCCMRCPCMIVDVYEHQKTCQTHFKKRKVEPIFPCV